MSIVERITEIRNINPKALVLFAKRAKIQLAGDRCESSDCPFALAGALGRVFSDRDVQVALFRACSDVGTNRARHKRGWQI